MRKRLDRQITFHPSWMPAVLSRVEHVSVIGRWPRSATSVL